MYYLIKYADRVRDNLAVWTEQHHKKIKLIQILCSGGHYPNNEVFRNLIRFNIKSGACGIRLYAIGDIESLNAVLTESIVIKSDDINDIYIVRPHCMFYLIK